MIYLLIVSLLWAFSFGLIKGNLTGIDSNFVSFVRMAISFLIFIPFIKIKKVETKFAINLIIIGVFQFGLMYISYIYSFQFLQAYEVALFTIFTPIYVTIINDIINSKFNKLYLFTAILSVVGTAIIKYEDISSNIVTGFLIIQLSNLCFAFGQIYYKKVMAEKSFKDKDIFAYIYLGAVLITLIFSLFTTNYSELILTTKQTLTLIYLGVVASGIGFFLWNFGARKVNSGTLAVFNNLKIPIAVLVSLIVFGEITNIYKLLIGGSVVIAALFINEKLK